MLLELLQALRGVVEKDSASGSLCPQLAGPATEVPKARVLGKRTWTNLGDPIGKRRRHVLDT